MSSKRLFLTYDDMPQHSRFEVIDEYNFVVGRGKTEEEAIASARKVSNAPIEFNGILLVEGVDY